MNLENIFPLVISPGNTVYDIGAYVGEVSDYFTTLCRPGGRVFSFEPHPILHYRLAQRAATNTLILPYCFAVSDVSTHATFYVTATPEDPSTNQASTIDASVSELLKSEFKIDHIKVQTMRLDDFIKRKPILPHFIKIDVEGAENRVIKGAMETIELSRPTIVLEIGLLRKHPRNFEHLGELELAGYQLYVIDVMFARNVWFKGQLPTIARVRSTEILESEDFVGNILAMPLEAPLKRKIDDLPQLSLGLTIARLLENVS